MALRIKEARWVPRLVAGERKGRKGRGKRRNGAEVPGGYKCTAACLTSPRQREKEKKKKTGESTIFSTISTEKIDFIAFPDWPQGVRQEKGGEKKERGRAKAFSYILHN